MQLPSLKSVTDIRRDAKRIFEEVSTKGDVVLVTKNTKKLSVIVSPEYFQSLVQENEALWEELEMIRSKEATKSEKAYPLKSVSRGKIRNLS